ncbi:cardiolipin synthase [Paraburkholderia sp. SARCC-3016]|uniref:cardiolipin synthase n=1 Tax=Paraburkholderia sp. SARCC-3016 TaxID=3058611 RepID=UPI0028093FFB|nr:cardiolipin synthase [Paraburkholderia sp. SARCC-3016]MDQ7981425.1 cardiolipin synthase [Paraburkholderia sp. SARCC-3016]
MQFDLLHIGTLVFLCHLLGLVAACHAILHTRTSQGAIAWAVSLVAMPYLTLVPYLFLGRSKFAGYVDARRFGNELLRTRAHPPEWETQASSYERPAQALGEHLVRSLTRLSGMPFLPGNTVRTLVNGEATFAAILEAIESARSYVIVQFFIVRADALGELIKDTLIRKVEQGVRAYVLYDSIGSFDLPHRYIAAMRAGGVEMHPFATNRRFVNRFQLNFRNHRKIVVVDGECAFVGGHNIGVEYLGAKPPLSPWRDTHIEVRGPAVASVQFVFTEDWYWATQQLPPLEPPPRVPATAAAPPVPARATAAAPAPVPASVAASVTASMSASGSATVHPVVGASAAESVRVALAAAAAPLPDEGASDTAPDPAPDTLLPIRTLPPPTALSGAGPVPVPARAGVSANAPAPADHAGDMHCLVVPSGPADKQETCSLFFVEAISAARKRIWITTPYLVPDEAVFSALRLAALRGVDVRILIPSRRDHIVVFEASRLYAHDSIRAGVRVFRYRPGFLHQKVVLIDDEAAAVGSANLDNRSFRLNFEIMVLTIDRGFAAEVEAMLVRDFAESYEIDRSEYRKSPPWRRMAMHVARLFAPIL